MKLRNKKTGEIREAISYAPIDVYFFDKAGKNGITRRSYGSLAELNEEWEDYVPTEPLIKDEKIRKAVRLCADTWEVDKILVAKSGSRIEFSDGLPSMRYVSFMYAEWQDEIKDRTYYTIEELCGEEEAPEPIEPMFIDLDGRIKEKGEE